MTTLFKYFRSFNLTELILRRTYIHYFYYGLFAQSGSGEKRITNPLEFGGGFNTFFGSIRKLFLNSDKKKEINNKNVLHSMVLTPVSKEEFTHWSKLK